MGLFDRYGYGPVAAIYDGLADFYSRGRIADTKRRSSHVVQAGDRVLYPGVGCGSDALEAARRGARVTAVDVSPRMLARCRARFDAAGLEADLQEIDVSAYRVDPAFDVIVANYFLNLFEGARARAMLERFAQWLRPGGLLVVSDFARPIGGLPGRLATEAYYRPINWIAWALRLCALHPILDYAQLFDGTGFEIRSASRLPVLGHAPDPAYVSIVAEHRPLRRSRATQPSPGGKSTSS